MATKHTESIKSYLESNGVTATIFNGPERDGENFPDEAIFIVPTGGPMPQGFADNSGQSLVSTRANLAIRSSTYGAAEELARDVWSKLHLADISGYFGSIAQNGGPIFSEIDSEGRYRFSVNIILRIIE